MLQGQPPPAVPTPVERGGVPARDEGGVILVRGLLAAAPGFGGSAYFLATAVWGGRRCGGGGSGAGEAAAEPGAVLGDVP